MTKKQADMNDPDNEKAPAGVLSRRQVLGLGGAAVLFALPTAGQTPAVAPTSCSTFPDPLVEPGEAPIVYRNIMVPMRDGVRLATDIYLPALNGKAMSGRLPAMLHRTPYDKTVLTGSAAAPVTLAKHGYAVVMQDKRGLFASEGTYREMMTDDGFGKNDDSLDTINWIARQPWCNGKIGLWGNSYTGNIALLGALSGSPHVAMAMPTQAASDKFELSFSGGAFRPQSGNWPAEHAQTALIRLPADTREPIFEELKAFNLLGDRAYLAEPLTETVFLRRTPGFWGEVLKHRDDPGWFDENAITAERMARLDAPLLLLGSWYDPLLAMTLKHYRLAMAAPGKSSLQAKHRIILGPWYHFGYPVDRAGQTTFPGSAIDYVAATTAWADLNLRGKRNPALVPPVQIYVAGRNRWRAEQSWPPVDGKVVRLLAGRDGSLSQENGTEGSDSFSYDPNLPYTAPSYSSGKNDFATYLYGGNVVLYTTAPFNRVTEFTGLVSATLFAASSATDTDWVVELHHVMPDNRSFIVCEGVLRARYRNSRIHPEPLVPGQVERYEIEMRATSLEVQPGERLRLVVTSGKFPLYERHPNSFIDLNQVTPAAFRVATQSVYRGGRYTTSINLPLLERSSPSAWINTPFSYRGSPDLSPARPGDGSTLPHSA